MRVLNRPETIWIAAPARKAALIGGGGSHIALWLCSLKLAEIVTLTEVALIILVILTAMYAPEMYSKRAFRLLPRTDESTTEQSNREPPRAR
jgi:hypothetical protein